jgi:ABC-2 type transport system ATP-binding protein
LAELVAEHLSKSFGSFQAVRDVSFRLEGHRCYGYLGPNGAGKTSTMKMFVSLLKPTGGRALVNGIDVATHPFLSLRPVGSLIEDPEPYPFMTVRQFIEFAVRVRDERKEADLDGLGGILTLPPLDSKCSNLSKGQKRRVYLAALLAQDPEVLILDEPSGGLDPAESLVFRNLIMRLKKEKLVFLSSHLLYEVEQLCDRVMFVDQGSLVEEGDVQEISRRFSSRGLKVEFQSEPAEQRLAELAATGLVSRYDKVGDRTYILGFDGKDESRRAIIDSLYPLGLRSVSDSRLGLEQAYLDLMS